MTLTEFKYILAVAQEKNFGRAADRCFVSQPTLSIAIKKLEEELDVCIFERLKTEVLLTPIGEKIVRQAQKVWDDVNELKNLARYGKNSFLDVLKLGAIFSVGPYLFPNLIPKIKITAPEMPIILQENYTKALTKKLLHGELDIIIAASPYEHKALEVQTLYSEELCIIIPPNHAWKNRDKIDPSDLKEQTVLMLGEGHCFRDDVLRACPDCAINTHADTEDEKMIEGGSLETIRHMVASGIGISVLPKSAINKAQYSDDYFLVKPFSGEPPRREIVIAYRQGYPRSELVELIKSGCS